MTAPPRKFPACRQIVVLDDLVAVVGDHMWAAKKGLEALDITWDDGANAKVNSQDDLGRPARGQRKGRRRRQDGRRHRQGPCDRREVRSVPTSCRSWRMRPMEPMNCTVHLKPELLRNLDRHADHDAGAVGSGEGRRASGRQGDRQPAPARRRLRPQARARHGGHGGAHRQAGRRPGQGGLDPRGRHPARHLSSGLSRHHRGDAVGRQDRRLEISHRRLVGARALAAAGLRERASTSTPSTARSTRPTTSRTSTSNMSAPNRLRSRPASGAASARTTMCSRSNASWTNWRARPARIRSNSGASHARQEAAAAGGAESGGGEIRLGPAAAGARRPRRQRPADLRQLRSRPSSRPRSTTAARCICAA